MKNLHKSIFILLLTGPVFFLSACDDNDHLEFPGLEQGTYRLKIYNARGVLVFEREGYATGTGSDAAIWMEDPRFLSETNDFEKFGWLGIYTSKTYDQPWSAKAYWPIRLNDTPVEMHQRFYGGSGDWCYQGTAGYVRIVEASDQYLKGVFRIHMRVKDASDLQEIMPGFEWTANPNWGEKITITGYFFSTHY